FCVVHDVTEQKNLERLKQDFVDMISHDLRSPLTSMLGAMTLVLEGARGAVSVPVQEEVEKAARNIEKLITFVNDLLDFQKLESGRIELQVREHELTDIFNDTLEMVRGFAESREVAIALPERPGSVRCDRDRIVQTLVNLVSNAIKFSPAGATVALAVDATPDFIELSVIDSGPGVPPEYAERIFEAFEQTPAAARAREGTGLGLAICKLIVLAHVGVIGVGARDDGSSGSKFWLRLPTQPDLPFDARVQVEDASINA
ncbi:MAG: sensor histidine kinase, partial [Terriglobales bacterium]